ncbi:uncharacterized protein LOC141914716 [Tubulanus polymorphus]|uniref:uncharacterized protein LOC141914716 n=1 Tax=Tubulanus polymorphus TaxID=672921 RepID=UPI003DA6A28E
MENVDKNQQFAIQLAHNLAGNVKKIRDRGLKKLRKWLSARSQSKTNPFTEEDFIKIWKGLHYCMWMQDKPLLQEDLADSVASLIHSVENVDQKFLFIESFIKTEAREWFGVDRWRLDKFLMMFRRFFQQALVMINNQGWKADEIKRFLDILKKTLINNDDSYPLGLKMHLVNIYWEELTTIAVGQIDSNQVAQFLDPYCVLLKDVKMQLYGKISAGLFMAIVKESDVGAETNENNTDEPETLKVDYGALADRLFGIASNKKCNSVHRKLIYKLVKKFRNLSEGIFPSVEISDCEDNDLTRNDYELAIKRLDAFEKKLDDKAKSDKKKNKQKRKLDESDDEIDIDAEDDDDSENEKLKKPKRKKSGKGKEKAASASGDSEECVLVGADSVPKEDAPKSEVKTTKGRKNKSKNNNDTVSHDTVINNQQNGNVYVNKELDEVVIFPKKPKQTESSAEPASRKKKATHGKKRKLCDASLTAESSEEISTPSKKSQKGETPSKKAKKNEAATPKAPLKDQKSSEDDSEVNVLSSFKQNRMRAMDFMELENEENKSTPNKFGSKKQKTPKSGKKALKNSEKVEQEMKTQPSTPSTKENTSNAVEMKPKSIKKVKTPKSSVKRNEEDKTSISTTPTTKNLTKTPKQDFITFDKLSKAPPAFVKKAVKKATPKQKTPVSSPAVKSLLATGTPESEKRVAFKPSVTVKAFRKSTPLNTTGAFSPVSKPGNGILKESPLPAGTPVTIKKSYLNSMKNSPKVQSPLVRTPANKKQTTTPKMISTPGSKKKKSPK